MSESNEQQTEMQFVVPPGHNDNTRLDKYITQFVQNATRNKVQNAINEGHVLVNGKKEKQSYKMQAGDVIDITLPKPPPPDAVPEDIPINIVYEDEDLLLVNKEPGMVVHPAFGNWTGTLVNGLLYHVDELSDEDSDSIRPGIVHRLDKSTSGLLVVAKNEVIHAALSKLFSTHTIERTYQAIVWGNPPEKGTIEASLGRSKRDRKKITIVPDGEGKHAVTHYCVLEYFNHTSLVELKLETGRTHQIRVHLSHLGYPVFGDPDYGGESVRQGYMSGQKRKQVERLIQKLGRQCLHAKTLGFVHPGTEEYVEFDSDLPEDFKMAYQFFKKEIEELKNL
jgi:23S rRNA pseudouridine1911/1915/1917 synthase